MRWYHIILILVVLAIIGAPIYFYIHYFGENIPSERAADWGPFGDYFGGIINPILSLFSLVVTVYIAIALRKIEDQRSEKAIETTYKPELIIEEKYFYIYTGQGKAEDIPVEFTYEQKGDMYLSPNITFPNFHLFVYNIGLGPTKRINIKYDFDAVAAVTLINEAAAKDEHKDRVFVELTTNTVSFKYNKNGSAVDGSTHSLVNQNRSKVDHLLTYALSPKPYLLLVPPYILELYAALYYCVWLGKDKNVELFDQFPPIVIEMKYSDIGGKLFTKKVQVNFHLYVSRQTQGAASQKVEELEAL
jgi:uncharacterized membrane protein